MYFEQNPLPKTTTLKPTTTTTTLPETKTTVKSTTHQSTTKFEVDKDIMDEIIGNGNVLTKKYVNYTTIGSTSFPNISYSNTKTTLKGTKLLL